MASWTKPITNLYGQAASYYNGHPNGKSKSSSGQYHNIANPAYSSSEPLQGQSSFSKPPSGSLTGWQKSYRKFRARLRVVVIFSLVISTLLTLFLEASSIYVVYIWLSTRHTVAANGSRGSPWAAGTITWPTYMLLGASTITFVSSLISLIVVCCRGRKRTSFSLFYNFIQILVWAVVAVLFKVYRSEKALWGWSCHPKAKAIQHLYIGVVNFDLLCNVQTADWYVAIVEAAVTLFFTLIGWYVRRKGSRVRRLIVNEIGDAGLTDGL